MHLSGGCEAVDYGSTMFAKHIFVRGLGPDIITKFTEVGKLIGN